MIDLTQFAGHTEGPWVKNGSFVYTDDRDMIMQILPCGSHTGFEYEANVRLCAAAPDLLAEVERLRTALADAIRRPMGVVPASAEGLFSDDDLLDAEIRRESTAAEMQRLRDLLEIELKRSSAKDSLIASLEKTNSIKDGLIVKYKIESKQGEIDAERSTNETLTEEVERLREQLRIAVDALEKCENSTMVSVDGFECAHECQDISTTALAAIRAAGGE